MRELPEHTAERLNRDAASLSYALLLRRTDGARLGLTDHDRDLAFTGEVFRAAPGMQLLALERTADLAPDHATVETALSPEGITAEDLRTGRYAEAAAELWLADTEDPQARVLLLAGALGEMEREGDRISLELRSRAHMLAASTGRLYQRSCDAQLGDVRCGVDMGAPGRKSEATIISSGMLTVTASPDRALEAKQLAGGCIRIENGPMAGLERPIRTAQPVAGSAMLTLWEALPIELTIGVRVTLTVGCDKTFATCQRFDNAQNFRGFPHVPGLSALAVQRSAGS